MDRRLRRWASLSLTTVLTAALAGCAVKEEKIKVTKLDDLPQQTYPYSGDVMELLHSEHEISSLAGQIAVDTQAVLDKYAIDDKATLRRYNGRLLAAALLDRRYDDAEAYVERIRSLEEKEAAIQMTGLTTLSMIDAYRTAPPADDFAAYQDAYQAELARRAGKLPWVVVQDEIQDSKGRLEIFSENLIAGIVQAQMQPTVDKTGELNEDMAAGLVSMHLMIRDRLPLKDQTIAVYQTLIDANRVEKPDIWAARDVELSAAQDYSPVLICAWDSGTDPAIFAAHLWSNANEQPNGRDDDGNGYVDDIHGIAYDIHAERTTGMLCPLGDAKDRMGQVMDHLKGFMDIQAAVDSPEATALKQHLSAMQPEDVQGFIEDLGLSGNYAHGTHVAGLMTAGNPFARLMIARLSYDHKMVPVARTVEWGTRDGQKCRDTVDYFKQHGVRVVNMSWGEAQDDAEQSLERNGIGASAEERREIARQVFEYQREGLYEAIKGAPDVLFVCAAGNSDTDVEFDQYIPSSFDLPNLLVVGAVDQAGDPTSFTSFGRTVGVYANGFEVDSYVPGGRRMKMSGTSMASPNVANLAGKLLAIDPSLEPTELIELIKAGADPKHVGDDTILLINPQRSIEMLKSHM